MDVVNAGQLVGASADAANLASKLADADQALTAGDVATATSLLTSITAANFPNLIGLNAC